MNVTRKDATITNTGPDDEFPGSFRVILSAPTEDRDGDTLLPGEWKTPLPEHITFDVDHEMSVRGTVGSGRPFLNDAGQVPEAPVGAVIVDGKYWSGDLGQETRSKVGEGHITKTSVAFLTSRTKSADGKSSVVSRELLNGAFVAIPSNREAAVLSSKAADVKAGARNSASDAEHIQAIHDHASALGATHGSDDAKTVFAAAVGRKDADTEAATDPVALISATDAAIDEAIDLFASVDTTNLDPAILQAIALVQAADASIDELMEVVGIPDPDEDAADSGATDAPVAGAEKSAPAAGTKVAPVEDADSDAVTAEQLETLALQIQAAQFI
jgi:hypothetical protein